MQLSYCDICGVVIKPNEDKYALVVQKFEEEVKETGYKDVRERMEAYNRNYDNLRANEICENCKKVYDHIFSLRKKEVEKILKQIQTTYKLKSKEVKKEEGDNGEFNKENNYEKDK